MQQSDDFDPESCECRALALDYVKMGLEEVLGRRFILWSNREVSISSVSDTNGSMVDTEAKLVEYSAKCIHVPGTNHRYQLLAKVMMARGADNAWEFRQMSVNLGQYLTNEYLLFGSDFDKLPPPKIIGVIKISNVSADIVGKNTPGIKYMNPVAGRV